MKILKIVNSKDTGGVFTCEQQFIKEFIKSGVIVDLIVLGNGDKREQYSSLGNKVLHLPELDAAYAGGPFQRIKGIIDTYIYGRKNTKFLAGELDGNYTTVIYRRPVYLFLAGILGGILGAKVFWHMPTTVNSKISKRFYTYFCRHYKISPIANSIYTKKTLDTICQHVVYPGYDESRVKLAEPYFREKLGIDDNSPVYGMVARVCHEKAQDLLVQAFLRSNIIESNGHLIIAGGCKDKKFLELVKEFAGSHLGKQIHLIGEIGNLPQFYSSIDVAVNSRRNEEAFGISVAEALGAGKPVIAYNLGGPGEMIQDRINGWLVETPDVDSYLKILNQSLADKKKWSEMGSKAKLGSKRYLANVNAQNMLGIVRNYS